MQITEGKDAEQVVDGKPPQAASSSSTTPLNHPNRAAAITKTFGKNNMRHLRYILRYGFLFVGSLFIVTLINVLVWQYLIHGVIYYKAPFFNPGGLDYILWIGNWIHEGAITVKSIDSSWTFKDPQQVRDGWTNSSLLAIWMIMFSASLVLSILWSWWLGRDKEPTTLQSPGGWARRSPIRWNLF
jgi:hypothetical protein